MSPVIVPPRPSRPSRGAPPREPPAPDPLDQADAALAKVRAALKDADEDELDTGRHEIHVTVNTGQPPAVVPMSPRGPQPSAHDLSEYVAPAVTLPKALGAITALATALGALGKALGWF